MERESSNWLLFTNLLILVLSFLGHYFVKTINEVEVVVYNANKSFDSWAMYDYFQEKVNDRRNAPTLGEAPCRENTIKLVGPSK